MNLLVVDWDFFIPIGMHNPDGSLSEHWMIYDWGHREVPFFIKAIWPTRAAGFARQGIALPDTTGEERTFWSRFAFAPRAQMFYADSNAWAASPLVTGKGKKARRWEHVWLYDAHHDAGYADKESLKSLRTGRWSCEDWMILYWALGSKLHVRYPGWRAYVLMNKNGGGEPEPAVPVERKVDALNNRPIVTVFDRVLVCRSGAWTPPWCDEKFMAFIESCPVPRTNLDGMKPRAWGDAEREQVARNVAEVNKIMEATTQS